MTINKYYKNRVIKKLLIQLFFEVFKKEEKIVKIFLGARIRSNF